MKYDIFFFVKRVGVGGVGARKRLIGPQDLTSEAAVGGYYATRGKKVLYHRRAIKPFLMQPVL